MRPGRSQALQASVFASAFPRVSVVWARDRRGVSGPRRCGRGPAKRSQRAPRINRPRASAVGAVGLWSLNGVLAKVVVTGEGLSALRLAEVRATGAALLLFTAVALVRPRSLRVSPREGAYLILFGVF